jgi:hypothetical protein
VQDDTVEYLLEPANDVTLSMVSCTTPGTLDHFITQPGDPRSRLVGNASKLAVKRVQLMNRIKTDRHDHFIRNLSVILPDHSCDALKNFQVRASSWTVFTLIQNDVMYPLESVSTNSAARLHV